MTNLLLIVLLLSSCMLLSACALLPPTPTDEQILPAIAASNEAEAEPLALVYEEMQVPHRLPGRAHAVLWVPDQSMQRNFTVVYDKKEKSFYVESYITLVSGEDGIFREVK